MFLVGGSSFIKESNKECLEFGNVCKKEEIQPVITGKILSIQTYYKTVSCNENYDKIVNECVRYKE